MQPQNANDQSFSSSSSPLSSSSSDDPEASRSPKGWSRLIRRRPTRFPGYGSSSSSDNGKQGTSTAAAARRGSSTAPALDASPKLGSAAAAAAAGRSSGRRSRGDSKPDDDDDSDDDDDDSSDDDESTVHVFRGLVNPHASVFLQGSSSILSDEQLKQVIRQCPKLYRMNPWRMLYSITKHGAHTSKLYDAASQAPGATLLIVKDSYNMAFGAFLTRSWPEVRGDFGNGETFLYTFENQEAVDAATKANNAVAAALASTSIVDMPTTTALVGKADASSLLGVGQVKGSLVVYRWTGQTFFFGHAGSTGLSFGGGGAQALFVDEKLQTGTSGKSVTFGNAMLSSEPRFRIYGLELWAHSALGL